MLDPVSRLLLDQAPDDAARVVCIDCASGLVDAARERWGDVAAYADRVDGKESVDELNADALGGVDLVLLQLPPGLGALEDYAERVAAWAAPDVRIVAAGRVKHMTRSQNDVLARSFGTVGASLGRDKCRAIHASEPRVATTTLGERSAEGAESNRPASAPTFRWPKRATDGTTGFTLVAYGATFNGPHLDAGTRLLLSTERDWTGGDAVDLGCGNGVIACVLAERGDAVTAIDVSRAAVASTRETLAANHLTGRVLLADGLGDLADSSQDLVVTNPPFHIGAAKDSSPTLRMLADARRVLRSGGELWCVYNSHLPYLFALREHFRDVRVVVRDRSYTVARAA